MGNVTATQTNRAAQKRQLGVRVYKSERERGQEREWMNISMSSFFLHAHTSAHNAHKLQQDTANAALLTLPIIEYIGC